LQLNGSAMKVKYLNKNFFAGIDFIYRFILLTHISAFKDVLEYGLTIIAVNPIISANLHEELLPSLHYRISTDYGRVEFAKSLASTTEDLFSSRVSICSKINSKAAPNGVYL
jgi:hypothetical protein